MRKIIVLGCSFSISGHMRSWGKILSGMCNLEMFNLAQAGGSNSLQVKRYQRAVIDSEIVEDDIVIWQITSAIRYNKRFKTSNKEDIYENFREDTPHKPVSVNIFDGVERSDCMHLHPNSKTSDRRNDVAENLQELIFHIIVCKKQNPKTLVIFGWDDVIPEGWETEFIKILENYNIDYIEESILSYVYREPQSFDAEYPGHPDEYSNRHFAEKVLLPKLNSMDWL